MADVLEAVVDMWNRVIRKSADNKEEQFGKTAKLAWKYYTSRNHDFAYDEHGMGSVRYKAAINKSAEFVKIFMPHIFQRVPHRMVTARRPEIPPEWYGMPPGTDMPKTPVQIQDDVRAKLLQWYLNWTCQELDLQKETRKALIEAMVKGRGLLWQEVIETPMGRTVGSFFGSVDHLFIDPDCESLEEASWIARRRLRPIWEVSREFGIPISELRAKATSKKAEALQGDEYEESRSQERDEETGQKRADVVEYYEVYSRCGLGHRFSSAENELKTTYEASEALGDHVFLVICDGVKYPLNLGPEVAASPDPEAEVQARLAWPIPYHVERSNPWPFTAMDFYAKPRSAWATSPLESSLPLMRFIDWAWSFLMQRIKATSRDIHCVPDDIVDEFIEALESGEDGRVVSIKGKLGSQKWADLIHTVKFQEVNKDIWGIIQGIEHACDKSSGLTELAYGNAGPSQMRSAAEAQIRQQNQSIRPDDMAQGVEQWQSNTARSEALAVRLFIGAEQVAPLFGEPNPLPQEQQPGMPEQPPPQPGPLTMMWDQLVRTDDPYMAAAEMAYVVEAGSGRRKNKAKQIQDMNDMGQLMMPSLTYTYQALGNPGPLNNWLRKAADAQEMDLSDVFMPVPPPPPMAPPAPGQPGAAPPPQQQGAA